MLTIIFSLTTLLHAQTIVNVDEAREAALRFAIKKNLSRSLSSPSINDSVYCPVDEYGDTLLYLVPVNGYHIIISRLKCFPPVLGYSNSLRHLDIDKNYFLQKYCYCSKQALTSRLTTISPQWGTLFQETDPNPRSLFIDTMLTTKWGQKYPNNGGIVNAYNYYITDSCSACGGRISPAGCIAVAMGQIMNYWQYPVVQYKKDREHQFDWCNMSDELRTTSDNYVKERNAIARLLADCGAASDMSYCYRDTCQSFTFPSDARKALVDTFGYFESADLKSRFWHTDASWKQLLVDDLNSGYPVFYASLSFEYSDRGLHGGHAFVCDGYDEDANLFHFNIGWNGTANGWYNIDSLIFDNGNDTFDYNHFERAIFKLHPPENIYRDICNYPLPLVNYYTNYYTISGNETPAPYENVPSISTVLYSASGNSSIPDTWNTIPSGESAEYVAHKEVVLLPGFTVERGANFVARIEPCPKCGQREVQSPFPQDNAPENISDERDDDDAIQSLPQQQGSRPQTTLYPNPTSGEVAMEVDGDVEAVVVFNTLGQPVGGWRMRHLSARKVTLDVSPLAAGAYLLTVKKTDGNILSGRFTKK